LGIGNSINTSPASDIFIGLRSLLHFIRHTSLREEFQSVGWARLLKFLNHWQFIGEAIDNY
jgi:hypothetical protein